MCDVRELERMIAQLIQVPSELNAEENSDLSEFIAYFNRTHGIAQSPSICPVTTNSLSNTDAHSVGEISNTSVQAKRYSTSCVSADSMVLPV